MGRGVTPRPLRPACVAAAALRLLYSVALPARPAHRTAALQDALDRLQDIYKLERSKADAAGWAAQPEEERKQKEAFYKGQQRAAGGFLRCGQGRGGTWGGAGRRPPAHPLVEGATTRALPGGAAEAHMPATSPVRA